MPADRFPRAGSHAAQRGRSTAGIDPAGFPMLRWIEVWGPLRVTDLAERIGLDASTVSRRVRDLEGEGPREPDGG